MATAVTVRADFSTDELRRLAAASKHAPTTITSIGHRGGRASVRNKGRWYEFDPPPPTPTPPRKGASGFTQSRRAIPLPTCGGGPTRPKAERGGGRRA